MSEIDQYKEAMQKARSELIDDLSQREFIIFAGAGTSETAGVKLWKKILHSLDEKQPNSEKKLNIDNWDDYEYPELAQILYGRYSQNNEVSRFYNIIRNEVTQTKENCSKLQNLMVRLSNHIITTNYDNTFEEAFQEEQIKYSSQKLPNLKLDNIRRKTVTYLHGSIFEEKPEIIFKTEDYAKYYSALSNGMESCVEKLLDYIYNQSTKAILFHGFSFGDRFIEETFSRLHMRNLLKIYAELMKQTANLSRDNIQHYALLRYSISNNNDLLPIHIRNDSNAQNKKMQQFEREIKENEKLLRMNISVVRYEEHIDALDILREIEKNRNNEQALIEPKDQANEM